MIQWSHSLRKETVLKFCDKAETVFLDQWQQDEQALAAVGFTF